MPGVQSVFHSDFGQLAENLDNHNVYEAVYKL